ncbi:MAG: hypothetical protein ACHQNA_04375 [Acidimicrobiales bacterium]
MSDPRRIDTHHHIVPPAYAAWLDGNGIDAGGLPIPTWTRYADLELMARPKPSMPSTPSVPTGLSCSPTPTAAEQLFPRLATRTP